MLDASPTLRLSVFTALVCICAIPAQAATVAVSSGPPGQGFTVSGLATPENPTPSYVVAVGYMEFGTNFVQFGQSILDSDRVSGTFAATFPPSFNTQVIHLFVGNGTTVEDSWSFVIFKATSNTAFPSDISAPTLTTFQATLPSVVEVVASSNASFNTGTGTINLIPEPSAPLLGLIAAGTLLSRRRRG